MLNTSVGYVVTASSVVDDPVSEMAPGISSVAVGVALGGMLTLVTVGPVARGISSVAVGEALGMLTLVTVRPVVDNNTTLKSKLV